MGTYVSVLGKTTTTLWFSLSLSSPIRKYEKLQKEKEELTEKLQSVKQKTVSVQSETTQANKKKKNLEQLLQQERKKLLELELVRIYYSFFILTAFDLHTLQERPYAIAKVMTICV